MSLIPFVPFIRPCPRGSSVAHTDLTVHLARARGSIVSRLLPQRSTAKHSSQVASPAHRLCIIGVYTCIMIGTSSLPSSSIVENLQAALAQLATIATDLKIDLARP